MDAERAAECERCLRANPQLAVPRAAFVQFVDARPAGRHVDDLLLACAALRAVPAAHQRLERDFFSALPKILARLRLTDAELTELAQRLREELLVGVGGQPAKLTRYSGTGPLGGWLRAVVTRTALSDLRRADHGRRQTEFDSQVMGFATAADHTMQALHERYASELEQAMRAALAELTSRERNVLRMYVLDGANIDSIGAVYRVHRATIARWIVEIRVKLADRTRALLGARFSASEVRSLAGLCFSQVDLSLERLLRATDAFVRGAPPSQESRHPEEPLVASAQR